MGMSETHADCTRSLLAHYPENKSTKKKRRKENVTLMVLPNGPRQKYQAENPTITERRKRAERP